MKLSPTEDRVIIKQADAKDKTESGLYLGVSKSPMEGTVIEAGPKCMAVQKGDEVYFGQFHGTDIIYNDVEYLIMRERDLLAVKERATGTV